MTKQELKEWVEYNLNNSYRWDDITEQNVKLTQREAAEQLRRRHGHSKEVASQLFSILN